MCEACNVYKSIVIHMINTYILTVLFGDLKCGPVVCKARRGLIPVGLFFDKHVSDAGLLTKSQIKNT